MRMLLVAVAALACSSPATPVRSPVAAVPSGAVAASSAPGGLAPARPTLRLPRNFVPASYAATLAIDPARAGFEGRIAITGDVSERSSVIWLHAYHLRIKQASAARAGATTPLIATPHGDDLLELRAQTPLDAGTWIVTIEYAGEYDELSTSGVFKQTVREAPYVYTQFEALYARRAFPCLDEPDNKVPWQLTLDVPSNLIAVSNTPVVRESRQGATTKRVEFAVTKPLPSYLVAFGVGPFDVVDAGTARSGAPIRVVTMKGRAPEAAWAVKTTGRLVELLEERFGSPYPYEKLDLLTIPITVGFGAMENPGLITFAETLMLLDPKRASRDSEYQWVVIAAHEIAHQWFGNLVTMAWWDDIWLNEGFANWMERKVSARFEPGWHEEISEIQTRNAALREDSLVSARQIRQPIVKTDDILNAFDGITYDKGASVLNMFEGYVGEDVFLRGVREYLKTHARGNATSSEFMAAISKAAGKDLGPALATFLEQPGAPEIAATLVCDKGRPPRVALSQQRYLPPGAPAARPGTWIVPVCVAYDRGGQRGEACTVLDAQAGSLALDTASCPRWVMPNRDGRGYYRASYTGAQIAALRDTAWPQLLPTERRALYFDVAEAAQVGRLPLPLALSFLPKLLPVGDRFFVGAALGVPRQLRDLVPEDLRASYEGWMRRTFGPAARKTGLMPRDGDDLDLESMRAGLIDAVANVGGDPALTAEAVKLAAGWRDLPQAMRGEVLALAAHASPAVFDRLLKDVHRETDRTRRQEILGALASARDPRQQEAALGLMLHPGLDIRDTQWMLFGARTEINRTTAQRFFQEHKDALLARIPSDATTGGGQSWIAFVFTSSCSAERRGEIVEYVNRTFAKLPGGERVVQQAIEGMDQCIARKRLLEPGIRAWLGGGQAGRSTAAR